MKKTQFLELFTSIKKTIVSFITIALLSLLALAVYTGFEWGYLAIQNSIDGYYKENNFHTLEIVSSLPFEQEKINRVKEIKGVDDVEETLTAFAFFHFNGTKNQARIRSITERIDLVNQIEGELPKDNGEIAVEKHWAKEKGIKIGDRIVFTPSALNSLKENDCVVTALVESPEYVSDEIASYGTAPDTLTQVNFVMFAPESSFDKQATLMHTLLVLSKENDKYNSFSKESKNANGELRKAVLSIMGNDTAIFTRAENVAMVIAESSIDMFDKLKLSMGLLMVIISEFICFVTITRMIYDNTYYLGIKKAMGLTKWEITRQYLLYAFLASVIGALLGIVVGRFIIENVFLSISGEYIFYSRNANYFNFIEALCLLLAVVSLSIITAFIACRKMLKKGALELLQGVNKTKSKVRFYEKSKAWKRLSLFTKTVIHNIFDNPKAVLTSVLSIVGCTMLCISSISVKDTINESFNRQYNKIQSYDTVVYFNPQDNLSKTEISNLLTENGYLFSPVEVQTVTIKTPDKIGVCSYIFACDEEIEKVFNLYSLNGEKGSLGDKVWISCAYTEEYGLKVGDKIVLADNMGIERQIEIGGIAEYYLQMPVLLMSNEKYESLFGKPYCQNALFVDSNGGGLKELTSNLEGIEGYVITFDWYGTGKVAFDSMNVACTAVMSTLLVLAVLMALFVILNMFLTYVYDRKKEILILMINGYSKKRAKKYVLTDFTVISVFGLIFGNVFGQLFSRLTILNLSGYTDYFVKGISLKGSLFGTLISVALIIIMTIFALKKIDGFDLRDANSVY